MLLLVMSVLMLLLLLLVMKNGHQLLLLLAGQRNRVRLRWHRAGRARGHRCGIDRVNRDAARLGDANVDADVDTTDSHVGYGSGTDGAAGGKCGMRRRLVLLERVLLAEALLADFAVVQFNSSMSTLVFHEETLSNERFFAE